MNITYGFGNGKAPAFHDEPQTLSRQTDNGGAAKVRKAQLRCFADSSPPGRGRPAQAWTSSQSTPNRRADLIEFGLVKQALGERCNHLFPDSRRPCAV